MIKNKTILWVSILVLSCFFSANAQRIKGSGNVVTTERKTNDYEGISVSGLFEVVLVEGSEGFLELQGEDNILAYITTEVKNKTLIIRSKKGVNLLLSKNQKVLITVPVEHINHIRLSGVGTFKSHKTLQSERFKITLSGARSLTVPIQSKYISLNSSGASIAYLEGETELLDIQLSGATSLSAFDLESQTVSVDASGASNAKVNALQSLTIRASGASSITYKGDPEKIQTKTHSAGSVSLFKD